MRGVQNVYLNSLDPPSSSTPYTPTPPTVTNVVVPLTYSGSGASAGVIDIHRVEDSFGHFTVLVYFEMILPSTTIAVTDTFTWGATPALAGLGGYVGQWSAMPVQGGLDPTKMHAVQFFLNTNGSGTGQVGKLPGAVDALSATLINTISFTY